MTLMDRLAALSALDAFAVLALVAAFGGISWRIEHPKPSNPSVSWLMAAYRRAWMLEMVTREPRIFDSQIMASLRQGTAFFASTALIAIGGVLALAGNPAPLTGLAAAIEQREVPTLLWQLRLAPVLILLTNAFLKFVWANRLFGYASVVMAAVPQDITDPCTYPRAEKAGEINIRAATNFNRGLRSIYFGLAALAWLAGPIALMAATVFTTWTLYRREFASTSRDLLLQDETPKTSDAS